MYNRCAICDNDDTLACHIASNDRSIKGISKPIANPDKFEVGVLRSTVKNYKFSIRIFSDANGTTVTNL